MFWLLALTIALLPSYLVRFTLFGVPTTLLEVLIYLSALGLLITQPLAAIYKRKKAVLQHYGLAAGLFLLGSIIGLIIAPDKRQALGLFKAYIFDPMLFFVVLAAALQNKKHLQTLLLALVGGGLLVGLSVCANTTNSEGRALGIYILDNNPSPNYLALLLAPIATLSLGLFLLTKIDRWRWLTIVSYLVMTAALIFSGSRGGYLATAFGSGLVFLFWLRTRLAEVWQQPLSWLTILFVAASLVLGGWLARPDLSPHPDHRTATSNNLRYEIWQTTVRRIIPAHWLTGIGLGNYQDYFTELTKNQVNYPEYISPWARSPHNIFLTIWTNLGLLGLIGLIGLLYLFFSDNRLSDNQQNGNQSAQSIGLALNISMISLLVHGLVDSAYWKNDLSLLFWILIALSWHNHQLALSAGRENDGQP